MDSGIKAKMSLNVQDYLNALDKAKEKTKNTGSEIAKGLQTASYGYSGIASVTLQAMNSLGTAGMLIAGAFMGVTAIIGGTIKGITSLASKFDSFAKQAKSVDMTVNGFLSLKHAVGLAGADLQKVLNISTRLDTAIQHATEGNEEYQKTINDIGLSWMELSNLTPENRILAIVSAIRKLKSEGKDIPTSFTEKLVGKRDMQTINKLVADSDFERNVIGATAKGFGMDENTVKQAEALNDAISNIGDGFLSWISKAQTVKWMMENIKDLTNNIAKSFTHNAAFKVDKQYAENAEGIGDVAEQMFTAGKFNIEQQRNMLAEKYKKSAATSNLDPSLSLRILNQQLNALDNATDTEVTQIFYKTFGKHIEDLDDSVREAMFKAVAENDSRFDFNNKDTWIQLKQKKRGFAELTPENATEEAILNIEKMQIDKQKEIISYTEKVKEVEDKLNESLNDELKKRIQIAAETRNTEIIANNIANIENTIKNKLSTQLDMTSAKSVVRGTQELQFLNPIEGSNVELQNTLARIDDAKEEIDLLERKNLLTQSGIKPNEENLKLYKEQLDALQEIVEKQKSINLLTSIKDTQISRRFELMDEAGLNSQRIFEENRFNAEQTKGSALNESELKLVNMQSQQQILLEYLKELKPMNSIVKTNSLASRGGMTGSTYVDQSRNAQKQLDQLTAIRRATELGNMIMQQTQTALVGY